MSRKERIIQLIDDLLESKRVFLINIIEALKSYAEDAVDPDEWDLKMMDDIKK